MNIEQQAAKRILESGVRVPIPAPLFLRVFGKKQVKITIRQPYMGTLMHISRLATAKGFTLVDIDQGDEEALHKLAANHAKTMARIVAVAMLNRKALIMLFSRLLGSWLLWKLKPPKLTEIVMTLVLLCGYQDFTSSIRLIRRLRMTKPKNLSPKDQGSQEAAQPDSIAPGE